MKLGRPASHIVAAVLFVSLVVGLLITIDDAMEKGGANTLRYVLFGAPCLVALIGLLSGPARWAYYFCAALLLLIPAYIVAADIFILFKAGSASASVVVPSLVGCTLLLLLFYRFTFGETSRRYYGFISR